jgi:hypothetical protein
VLIFDSRMGISDVDGNAFIDELVSSLGGRFVRAVTAAGCKHAVRGWRPGRRCIEHRGEGRHPADAGGCALRTPAAVNSTR